MSIEPASASRNHRQCPKLNILNPAPGRTCFESSTPFSRLVSCSPVLRHVVRCLDLRDSVYLSKASTGTGTRRFGVGVQESFMYARQAPSTLHFCLVRRISLLLSFSFPSERRSQSFNWPLYACCPASFLLFVLR
jgi:hypothetical protein